ncbi:MAG: SGNH/GDSL hydrolase family protein [Cyclobacteriaceae bacterium]
MKLDTLTNQADSTQSINFLALGDSYTIGESVPQNERWPVLLAKALNENNILTNDPTIVAITGWTTDELQRGIANAALADSYDLVSLLIGVNNQYRGYPIAQYETEFTVLIDKAIAFAGGSKGTFVVSIPDYGVTPFGQTKDPETIGRELDEYNAMAKEIAEAKGVLFIDITPISREALTDPTLVAGDGLHPSGKMYLEWVELMTPKVLEILGE